ncbi:unnamed protein product, partial [Prunus brigantina]
AHNHPDPLPISSPSFCLGVVKIQPNPGTFRKHEWPDYSLLRPECLEIWRIYGRVLNC